MKRIKIADGSSWPNPADINYQDLIWQLRDYQSNISQSDLCAAAEVMAAYEMLICHPAMTLKKVISKISGIRKAIKKERELKEIKNGTKNNMALPKL